MDNSLVERLSRVGKHTEIWNSPDGSAVLVLQHGGRILGLFPPGSDQNFFWTHPALQSIETADAFYKSGDWHNSGGDRTWLAPEIDFFLPNFPKLEPYIQPREFDPGSYQLTRDNGSIHLTNLFSSKLSRSGDRIQLKITKRLNQAANPLRNFGREIAGRLEYAGYSLHTRLEVIGHEHLKAQVGLWSLLQMPHGGDLIVPTFSKPEVRCFTANPQLEDIRISDQLLCYRMNSTGAHKIGVSAWCVTGRAGYHFIQGDLHSLVIRNFSINPSGDYVDVPWHDAEYNGAAAFQACQVNGTLGKFSELEYHVPAISGGQKVSEDESQVWAFRGKQDDISAIGKILLSPEF